MPSRKIGQKRQFHNESSHEDSDDSRFGGFACPVFDRGARVEFLRGVARSGSPPARNGAEITCEHFRPDIPAAAQTKRPAILMLHGVDGADKYGRYYREYARALSAEGFHVFYVHYFDTSPYDNLLGMTDKDLGETILRDRDDWIDAVADVLGQVGQLEEIDPGRVGLLGFSLGGFVSLSATERLVKVKAKDRTRPACVVEFFGGLFEDGHGRPVVRVEDFPPTLILHGEQDQRVPVAKAYELQEKLAAAQVPYEIKTYPDRGHSILGEDAGRRAIAFFKKHLDQTGE